MAAPPTLLLALRLCLIASAISAWKLTPPLGYSVHMRARAVGGVHVYKCRDGDWLPESAFAALQEATAGNASEVGKYSFVYLPSQPRYVGTWILHNSRGDAAESGSPVSLVSGKRIASSSARPGHLPEFLAEASLHQSSGTASIISYIACLNTRGGLPPPEGYCPEDNAVVKIPFSAEFYLWQQNFVPPAVPPQLQLDSHQRPVESFFAKGVAKYVFDGKAWIQRKLTAKLYNLPGGSQVGSYLHKRGEGEGEGEDEESQWSISNPNGFQMMGRNKCDPIPVEPSSLPWALMSISSSSGNTSMLGPYSYIHMLSTNGGLAPKISKASAGSVWRSPFSAIFWFYSDTSSM